MNQPNKETSTNENKQSASEYISTREAAEILGLSTVRVRQFCQAGRLGVKHPVLKLYLISRKEIEEFAATQRPNGRPLK